MYSSDVERKLVARFQLYDNVLRAVLWSS